MTKKHFTDPIVTFNEIWDLFDIHYGGFEVKKIDWKKLFEIYRKKIDNNSSEEQVFKVLTDMLRHLNDNHVQLRKENPRQHFSSGSIGYLMDKMGYEAKQKLFTSKPVSGSYFDEDLNELNGFSYAWLEDEIGYLHFGSFQNLEQTEKDIEHILHFFSHSKAIIVDIRRNVGGYDEVGKAIADCFADRKRKYMITAEKSGKGHNEFGEQTMWYVEPKASIQYLNPVVLLTDNTTFSAAENFALAMRELPHVSQVGDFTSGGFADASWKTISCGWEVCIPYALFTDKNGFCWEGIGIPPHYRIITDPTKTTETDTLIDFSIDLLNNN